MVKRRIFENWAWETGGLAAGPRSYSTDSFYKMINEMALDTDADDAANDISMRDFFPMEEARRGREAAAMDVEPTPPRNAEIDMLLQSDLWTSAAFKAALAAGNRQTTNNAIQQGPTTQDITMDTTMTDL